jgi:hypothetical protein
MMRAMTRPEVEFPLTSLNSTATGQLSADSMLLKSAWFDVGTATPKLSCTPE